MGEHMSSMRAQAERTISLLKGRWDLTLLFFYAVYVIWSVQPVVDGLDLLWAFPMIFFGAGYSFSYLYVKPRMLSGNRMFLSVTLSCVMTAGLAIMLHGDEGMVLTTIGIITMLSCALVFWMRGPERLQEASILLTAGMVRWDSFVAMERKRRYTWSISVAILVLLLASVWSISTTPPVTEKYTEFYVTGVDGMVESVPNEVIAGTNYSLNVGLANHEHRTINYVIQVWLIESKTVNNNTNVSKAYFVDSFGARLISIDPSSDGQWTFQWESKFTFNLNVTGNYKMFFLLSKNGNPVFQENLTKMQDYAGAEVESLINQARLLQIQSLNLNLRVSEATAPIEAVLELTSRPKV